MRRLPIFKLQRRNLQAVMVTGAFLLVMFLFPTPRQLVEAPFRDIWRLGVTARRLLAFVGRDARLQYQNEQTNAAKLASVDDLTARLNGAEAEAASLRAELQLKDPKSSFVRVPANVLMVSEPGHAWRMHIDVGVKDGVKEGMAVVVGGGTLIGAVEEAQDGRSVVRLLADQGTKIPVMFLGGERTRGVVVGDGGERYRLTLVPREANPAANQILVTSGLDGLLPRGLVIGAIDTVADDPRDPFLTATIRPEVDPRTLNVVSVVFEKL